MLALEGVQRKLKDSGAPIIAAEERVNYMRRFPRYMRHILPEHDRHFHFHESPPPLKKVFGAHDMRASAVT